MNLEKKNPNLNSVAIWCSDNLFFSKTKDNSDVRKVPSQTLKDRFASGLNLLNWIRKDPFCQPVNAFGMLKLNTLMSQINEHARLFIPPARLLEF